MNCAIGFAAWLGQELTKLIFKFKLSIFNCDLRPVTRNFKHQPSAFILIALCGHAPDYKGRLPQTAAFPLV